MRFIRHFAQSSALVIVVIAIFLLITQHRMIYFPRTYLSGALDRFKQVAPLSYRTAEGEQQSYFVPARAESARHSPSFIWVVFSGNGGLALDWMDFIASYPADDEAFLLIDYPGYGSCAGKASSETIRDSSQAALAALAAHLGAAPETLEPRLRVLGYSMGAAAGLQFASRHPVSRVVLLAPFTSLREMARRSVGWPLCYLLLDNFDNRARFLEIAGRDHAPAITILSGTEDTLVPPAMGRELAGLSPGVKFVAVEEADHDSIVADGEEKIVQAMTGLSR